METEQLMTTDGRAFEIRRPAEHDAEGIIEYSKILFASTDQTLTTLEEYTISVADEKVWINNSLINPSAMTLVGVLDGQIIGMLFFNAQPKKKHAHTGEFGVSVHPGFQALGVGRALIGSLLRWARGNPRIEKVFLQVFVTNTHAIRLYKELGFIEEGRHIKAIKLKSGEYVDVIQMYLETVELIFLPRRRNPDGHRDAR